MPLAAGALTKSYGTTVNHIINGASLTANSISVSGDIDNAFTNADGYPFADIALTLTCAVAPSAGLTVVLYRRNLDIVSTNDQPIPDSNYLATRVGSVIVDAVATEQYLIIEGVPIQTTAGSEFYIENKTGQTINATWDLDVKPWAWILAT